MLNETSSVNEHNWELQPEDPTLKALAVPDKKTVTIGRQASCEYVISDPYISRQHASLEVRSGGLYLKDLDSTQGSFVNDVRITESQIHHGDTVRMEKYRFTVRQLDYQEDADTTDDSDATVIRKIPEPADAGTVVIQGVQLPPSGKQSASDDVPPAAEPSQAAAPQSAPAAASDRKEKRAESTTPPASVIPEKPADAEQPVIKKTGVEEAAAGKGNWWEQQQGGPKGTELFKINNLPPEGDSLPEVEVDADGPMLVGRSGVCKGEKFRLQNGKFILGKGDSADIHIADTTVSDVHAQIIGDGNGWQVVNLMSTNGTFVNGKKVRTAVLSPGDVIRMGSVELQFVNKASSGKFRINRGSRSLIIPLVLITLLITIVAAGFFALTYFDLI